MSDSTGGLLTIALLVGLLALVCVPLGDYMARVYTSSRHLRVERGIYRLTGVDPDAEQGARSYATSVVGFSLVSIVALTGLLVGQAALPMDRDLPGVPFWMSFNTAISFVTTPTGSPTPVSRRWASPRRWRVWRSRTSSPPRSAWRSPSP